MKTIVIILIVIAIIWSIYGYFGSRVEQANYIVIKYANGYEVREYAKHIEAQATVEGSYNDALSQGFRIIAGYIFGGNTKKESISMTTPVMEKKEVSNSVSEGIAMTAPVVATIDGNTRTISFVMPSKYTLGTLPTPNDTRVHIVEVPVRKMAVLRFGFYRNESRVQSMKESLMALLKRDGVETVGTPAYAGYNAPGTPPWMIRNEVMVEVK